MKIKQISIFVENKGGRLAEITKILANKNINIRALSIADTTKFGILRLIVDKPELAFESLNVQGLTVSVTEVLAISVNDRPGGFAQALEVLSAAGVGVEYVYAFIAHNNDRANVILRVEDNDKAISAFEQSGYILLKEEDVYSV